MMRHLIPENDEADHAEAETCACKPQFLADGNGRLLCVHRAFDMRHLTEQADAIRLFVS